MSRLIGIYRESSHSPGRVDDDAAIMEAVASRLTRHGRDVTLVSADAGGVAIPRDLGGIFAMCEQHAMLRRLVALEREGVAVVNTPSAVRNTYRRRTVRLLNEAGIAAPMTWQVDTRPDTSRAPAGAIWLKRADFHATQADDVTFVDGVAGWDAALARFAARGIEQVLAQAHVPGALVKFYGVAGRPGRPGWFSHHRAETQPAENPCDEAGLRRAAFGAAAAIGVEVFGGDAIIDAEGIAWIVDLNAWPSFARCREIAADAIARLLLDRFPEPRHQAPFRSGDRQHEGTA